MYYLLFWKIAGIPKYFEDWILLCGQQPLPTDLKIPLFIYIYVKNKNGFSQYHKRPQKSDTLSLTVANRGFL